MTAFTFDTHAAVRGLIEAGLDERQAEAVTAVVRNAQDAHLQELATKEDLLRLETKLEHVEERLLVRLGGLMIALFGIAVAWFELRSG